MFVYQRVHSGPISSRPHTTEKSPQKAAVWFREMGPLISGTSRLVKYYSIWPDTSTQTVGTFSIVIRSFSGESLFLLHFVDVNIYIYIYMEPGSDQSGLWSIWGQAGRHALPYHKWTCIETDGRSWMGEGGNSGAASNIKELLRCMPLVGFTDYCKYHMSILCA